MPRVRNRNKKQKQVIFFFKKEYIYKIASAALTKVKFFFQIGRARIRNLSSPGEV